MKLALSDTPKTGFLALRPKCKVEGKNQEVRYLTWSIIWDSDLSTRKYITQENQLVSPFPAGDHKATIRNCYNQVPYLTQNTIWESDKNTSKYNTQEIQESCSEGSYYNNTLQKANKSDHQCQWCF